MAARQGKMGSYRAGAEPVLKLCGCSGGIPSGAHSGFVVWIVTRECTEVAAVRKAVTALHIALVAACPSVTQVAGKHPNRASALGRDGVWAAKSTSKCRDSRPTA